MIEPDPATLADPDAPRLAPVPYKTGCHQVPADLRVPQPGLVISAEVNRIRMSHIGGRPVLLRHQRRTRKTIRSSVSWSKNSSRSFPEKGYSTDRITLMSREFPNRSRMSSSERAAMDFASYSTPVQDKDPDVATFILCLPLSGDDSWRLRSCYSGFTKKTAHHPQSVRNSLKRAEYSDEPIGTGPHAVGTAS